MPNRLIDFLFAAIEKYFSANTRVVVAAVFLLNQAYFKPVGCIPAHIISRNAPNRQRSLQIMVFEFEPFIPIIRFLNGLMCTLSDANWQETFINQRENC